LKKVSPQEQQQSSPEQEANQIKFVTTTDSQFRLSS
jgi:hypothetical protein